MIDTQAVEARVAQLLRSRRPGHSLPAAFYNDPDIFALDMQAIFHRHWLCVGATCEVAEPGQYITVNVGDTGVIVLRDGNGEVRAFYNSCRHRGSRILDERCGRAKTLVCPYHRWTYKLDGRLAYASWMPEDFNRADYPLKPVHVRTLAGTVYICLADDPPDFSAFAAGMEPLLRPHALERAKVALEVDLIEEGNWKLVMENSRECYHCATQHKLLVQTLLDIYDFRNPSEMGTIQAFWDRLEADGIPCSVPEGPDFRATRLPFVNNALSITEDGKPAVARLLGDVPHNDIGSLRWVHYPSVFNHALGDYAVIVRMLPLAPQRTLLTTKFLVDRDAVEGVDYDLERLTHVWNVTNVEDRNLVQRNQAGVNNRGYEPGPYSPALEAGVIKFIDWYCGKLADHMDGRRRETPRLAAE